MKSFVYNFLFFASLLIVSACGSMSNGPHEALTAAEIHPVTVERQTYTLTVAVDPSINDITTIDKARLRAFARTYFSRGEGAITIIAPSGGPTDFSGQELVADIRQELFENGIGWEKIHGATYREGTNQASSDIVLTFSNYVASASACGKWSSEFANRFRNLPTENFGCASQNNFAAMIADPRDLIRPSVGGASDMARTATVYDKYGKGEATSSEQDNAISVQASESE